MTGVGSRSLDAAYRATSYDIFLEPAARPPPGRTVDPALFCRSPVAGKPIWSMRIDALAPSGLRAWMRALGCDTAAFLTAVNPRSQSLPAHENEARMSALDRELSRLERRAALRGASVADAGDWPPEESRFVVGLSEKAALELVEAFDQNAWLWIRTTAPVHLRWTGATVRR